LEKIDFLVIGAQKSGTTSLHNYLSEHPRLCLPKNKEAPYFCRLRRKEEPLPAYLSRVFPGCGSRLRGTVTPQYMSYLSSAQEIRRAFPEVKLIACLREPVARTFSHYKMNRRRGLESRSFDEMVDHLLREEELAAAREVTEDVWPGWDEVPFPVVWSEYGRILAHYLGHFPREQLLFVDSASLLNRPEEVFAQVCRFLGVDDTFAPRNLGKKYHGGGTRKRLPDADDLKKNALLRTILAMIPPKLKRSRPVLKMRFWYEIWNVRQEEDSPLDIPSATREKLAAHFRKDLDSCPELAEFSRNWFG